MIPVLKAEEALMDVHVLQLGGGLMEKHEGRRAFRQLQAQAELIQKAPKATPQDLAAMGIDVEIEK